MKILKVDYQVLIDGKMNDNSDSRWESAIEVRTEREYFSFKDREDIKILSVKEANSDEKEYLAFLINDLKNTEVDRWNADEHAWAEEFI